MLVDIYFPALKKNQRSTFLKLGLRRAQAISVVDAAVVLTFEKEFSPSGDNGGSDSARIESASITLGAVAPTIIHASEAEAFLAGKTLNEAVIAEAAQLAVKDAHPIDDLRSSSEYRREMVRVCVQRSLQSIVKGDERKAYPAEAVLLWGKKHPGEGDNSLESWQFTPEVKRPILTRINGVEYRFDTGYHKSLLRLLREEAGLIGTKEGCAEGECGACTVFLDGVAVMSCLVPAPRAHGAEIITIEGIADNGNLHPVQKAFIDEGAVQCGYCIPGFIMSAVKLLEESPRPSKNEIHQAITGNLCRCTGYYKIVQAIESASRMEATDG
jgi:xanthine dehydrogenase iron-sulfur cluster and FAD-binding subunit A